MVSIGRESQHCCVHLQCEQFGGRLARVVDGRKENEDQTAHREEMEKRLPQEPHQ
jgi:hypothetical protein